MESVYRESTEEEISAMSDLEAASHLYGIVKSYQQEQIQEQLEKTWRQVKSFRDSKRPGSRKDFLEEGKDLWADICNYWDTTGKYDINDLKALTPIMASQEDLGVALEEVRSLEELKDELDDGVDYFQQ